MYKQRFYSKLTAVKKAVEQILIFTNTDFFGGAENHLCQLASLLKRAGYAVTFAYLFENSISRKKELQRQGIKALDLEAKFKYDPRPIFKLADIIAQYDYVHLNLFQAEIYGLLAAKIAKYNGKIISAIHNMEELYQNKLITWFYRFLFSGRVDRYVAISKAVSSYFQKKTHCMPARIKVIYYGVGYRDQDFQGNIKLTKYGLSKADLKVALIGRYAPQKGHEFLVGAIPLIIKQIPQAKFLFIGRDEKKLKPKLIALAEKLNVLDRIVFIPEQKNILPFYKQIDLLALPSIWEGLGLVVLEAMSARVPVVASAVGPLPEIIDDGQTGLLVKPKNAEALATAVVKLLRDRKLCDKLTANAYRTVKLKFCPGIMLEKYLDLLKGLK